MENWYWDNDIMVFDNEEETMVTFDDIIGTVFENYCYDENMADMADVYHMGA